MAQKAIFATLLSGSTAALLEGERDLNGYTYDAYVQEFHKDVDLMGLQGQSRREIFETNLQQIRTHNADPSKTWFATVNEFTDWKFEEFTARRIAKTPSPENLLGAGPRKFHQTARLEDLPDAFDWRDHDGVVTAPKNQGGCGSCWAFSATETLESHYAIATGEAAPILSPQQITSCTPNPDKCGGSGGCNGATQPIAFNYTEHAGITTEANYPYQGRTGTCQTDKIKPVVKNSGYVKLPVNDYSALISAVATQGPISISVAAGGLGWQFYGGGVFSGGWFGCGWTVDHAVQLVGYGTDGGKMYWLVRNSWGGSWGESGYIRIERKGDGKEPCGKDTKPSDGNACAGNTTQPTFCGLCGILSASSYPTGVAKVDGSILV